LPHREVMTESAFSISQLVGFVFDACHNRDKVRSPFDSTYVESWFGQKMKRFYELGVIALAQLSPLSFSGCSCNIFNVV
jgi:hypothetical protein